MAGERDVELWLTQHLRPLVLTLDTGIVCNYSLQDFKSPFPRLELRDDGGSLSIADYKLMVYKERGDRAAWTEYDALRKTADGVLATVEVTNLSVGDSNKFLEIWRRTSAGTDPPMDFQWPICKHAPCACQGRLPKYSYSASDVDVPSRAWSIPGTPPSDITSDVASRPQVEMNVVPKSKVFSQGPKSDREDFPPPAQAFKTSPRTTPAETLEEAARNAILQARFVHHDSSHHD